MQLSSIDSSDQQTTRLSVAAAIPSTILTVQDGSWRECAKGIGQLDTDLPAGIYKVVARIGRDNWDQLIELDGTGSCHVAVPDFGYKSISPLLGTNRSHEYQSDIIEHLSDPSREDMSLGTGARIQLVSRNWSPEGDASELLCVPRLERWRGDAMFTLGDAQAKIESGDTAWSISVGVDPGAYLLVVPTPNGEIRQMLYALDGWDTQAFILSDFSSKDRSKPTIELVQQMCLRGYGFDREKYELVEAARTAMADNSAALHPEILDEAAYGKFENPLLGLMAAHVLLIARDLELEQGGEGQRLIEFDQGRFDLIVGNTAQLLGHDQPDVVALRTLVADFEPTDVSVSHPPIFRASWDLLVEASNTGMPDILPENLYRRVRGTASMPPYFSWTKAAQPAARRARKAERQMQNAIEKAILASGVASSKTSHPNSPFDFLASTPTVSGKPDASNIAQWAPDLTRQLGTIPQDAVVADVARRLSRSINLPNSAIRSIAKGAFALARKKTRGGT